MNKNFKQEINEIKKNNLQIIHNVRADNFNPAQLRAILAGYEIIKLNKSNPTFTTKEEFINEINRYQNSNKLFLFLKEWIDKQIKDIPDQNLFNILNNLKNYSADKIFTFLNYGWPMMRAHNLDYSNSKLSGLDNLILTLAQVNKNDAVLDPTSGFEGSWLELLKINPEQNITLQEKDKLKAAFAYLNAIALHANNFRIYNGDSLAEPEYVENQKLSLFDKVLTFPPISMRISKDAIAENKYNRFRYGKVSTINGDLAFISNAIASLNENGKAILLIANGPLFRKANDRKIRQTLINQDLVEAVISLPPKLLPSTGIPTNLMIINKNKKDFQGKILFINADQKDWFTTSRISKTFTAQGIEEISHLYQAKAVEEGKSVIIDNEDYKGNLLANNYILPAYVTIHGQKYHINHSNLNHLDALTLGDLVVIRRGYNVTKRNENAAGDILAVKVTDIEDHQIRQNGLTKISIRTDPSRYLIKDNDALLSTRGTVGKVALVRKINRKIVPNANMVILRAKTDQINTKWLMLYLASPLGQFMIQQAANGTTVSTISIEELQNIKVPKLSIEEQNRVVANYEEEKKSLDQQKAELIKKYRANDKQLYRSMAVDKVLVEK